ncbi:MAG: threonylcarbamoyl-AMP synthase [Muribaculaceae bacterium]|nr:threonylcarbamoyl-AMP synthase [Muribaculaceae bacterium]
MKTFKMYASSVNERYLDELVEILKKGGVIIYPTDSLYAIGCDALNNRAVEKVCRIKEINPARQRLSMVCSGISQASEFARIDNEAFRLLKMNLPGPFTFILPASTKLAKAFKGRHEVGVRVPDNAIATRLAEAMGNPLLSASVDRDDDSANEPMDAEEIMLRYNHLADAMVDGGQLTGIPSAVVDLTDPSAPEILREGPAELRE